MNYPTTNANRYRVEAPNRASKIFKDGGLRFRLKIRGSVLGTEDEMVIELMVSRHDFDP